MQKTLLAALFLIGLISANIQNREPGDNVFHKDCSATFQNQQGQTEMCCRQVRSGYWSPGGIIADFENGYEYCQCLYEDGSIENSSIVTADVKRCVCTNSEQHDLAKSNPQDCPPILPEFIQFALTGTVVFFFAFVLATVGFTTVKMPPNLKLFAASVSVVVLAVAAFLFPGGSGTGRYPNVPAWLMITTFAAFVAYWHQKKRADTWLERILHGREKK